MLYLINYNPNPAQYTILNTANGETRVLDEETIKPFLSPRSKIENLKLEKGQVKGTRGDLKRYMGGAPVILHKLEDSLGNVRGFEIVGRDGNITSISIEEAISMDIQAEQMFLPKFANAKVPTNKQNNSYVVCLGGSFPVKIVRSQRHELERLVVEIYRKGSSSYALITLTDTKGLYNRQKIVVDGPCQGQPDGELLGKVFNQFLKYRLYDIIDGQRMPGSEKPMGVVISKTAYYMDNLAPAEYLKVAEYLGILLEKVVDKQSTCVYQIKL